MNRKEKIRNLVAELIPMILLGFYVIAIGAAIWSTTQAYERCRIDAACAQAFNSKRIEGVNLILNVVGGLVSALVVVELAVTHPGELPSAQIVTRNIPRDQKKMATVISMAFILVWLAGGAAAVAMFVIYPIAVPAALSEFAKAWLGLALASAYSYLGIE